jgi:hypothetical protein
MFVPLRYFFIIKSNNMYYNQIVSIVKIYKIVSMDIFRSDSKEIRNIT